MSSGRNGPTHEYGSLPEGEGERPSEGAASDASPPTIEGRPPSGLSAKESAHAEPVPPESAPRGSAPAAARSPANAASDQARAKTPEQLAIEQDQRKKRELEQQREKDLRWRHINALSAEGKRVDTFLSIKRIDGAYTDAEREALGMNERNPEGSITLTSALPGYVDLRPGAWEIAYQSAIDGREKKLSFMVDGKNNRTLSNVPTSEKPFTEAMRQLLKADNSGEQTMSFPQYKDFKNIPPHQIMWTLNAATDLGIKMNLSPEVHAKLQDMLTKSEGSHERRFAQSILQKHASINNEAEKIQGNFRKEQPIRHEYNLEQLGKESTAVKSALEQLCSVDEAGKSASLSNVEKCIKDLETRFGSLEQDLKQNPPTDEMKQAYVEPLKSARGNLDQLKEFIKPDGKAYSTANDNDKKLMDNITKIIDAQPEKSPEVYHLSASKRRGEETPGQSPAPR